MSERLLRGYKSETGQGVIAIVVSIVIFVAAGYMLYRTVSVSRAINEQAESIEGNATSINTSASSIARLVQTEAILDSILATSKPLVPSLNEIIDVAKSIDGTAVSIGNTIGGINSNARAIGGQVNSILSISRQISGDIISINNLLDATITVGREIESDSGPIENSLESAHVSTCGIGVQVLALGIAKGNLDNDPHC